MNKKLIIAVIACMMVVSLSACTNQTNSRESPKKDSNEQQDQKGIRTIINTNAGDLELSYGEGIASLDGTLQRSTPCVNWQIDAIIMESFPEQVRFSITDKSTSQMCAQVIGEPQKVHSEAQVSDQAKIIVLFEEEAVYDGQLE